MKAFYPIGTPGMAWGATERAQWLAQQRKHRSFADEVETRIERLATRFDLVEYGQLDYPPDRYRQLALRSRGWRDAGADLLSAAGRLRCRLRRDDPARLRGPRFRLRLRVPSKSAE